MSTRYATLREAWVLRGWADDARYAVNWQTGEQCRLGKHAFYVAQACDGTTNLDSPAFSDGHRALLDRLVADGIAADSRPGDTLHARQAYRRSDTPRISGIHWAVTGRCNLTCRHCYMDAPSGRVGEAPHQRIVELIEQFAAANVLAVSLTGGEPLLRDDLLDIVERLTAHGIRVANIYTNGTLVDERLLKELVDLDVRPVFRISYDGVGAHDGMRGTAGVEPLVIDAIRRLSGAGFQVAVATCVDRTSLGRLDATYDLMKELAPDAWGIARPQPAGCWKSATTALGVSEFARACEGLLRRWLADGRPFMIGMEAFFSGPAAPEASPAVPDASPAASGVLPAAPGTAGTADRDATAASYACGSCRDWPYLAGDGTLLPCIGYEGTALAADLPDVFAVGFQAAWEDPALRRLLDLTKADVLARGDRCASCRRLGECGTGCRASALVATGDLYSPDPGACALFKGGYQRRFAEIAARGV